MSMTIPLDQSLTPALRTSAALERAQAALPEAANAKLLQAVLLEAAAGMLINEPVFAERVRERYATLATPPRQAKAKGGAGGSRRAPRPTPKVSDLLETLKPIKHIPDLEITLAGPPDPYFLLNVFGAHQLARALDQRSLADVRKAAKFVQARNPGTPPDSKAGKAHLIEYIVERVSGSVTFPVPGRSVPQD